MVDSVAGSVVGSQLQGVRSSIVALKVDKEVNDASVRSIEASADAAKQSSSGGRGSIVDLKV